MSVGILSGEYHQALYCSTTDVAFGPLFSADDDVQSFLEWLSIDPRTITETELVSKKNEWSELPICTWCDKHTEDTLREWEGSSVTYQLCDECRDLLVDEDDLEYESDEGSFERLVDKADFDRKALREG